MEGIYAQSFSLFYSSVCIFPCSYKSLCIHIELVFNENLLESKELVLLSQLNSAFIDKLLLKTVLGFIDLVLIFTGSNIFLKLVGSLIV